MKNKIRDFFRKNLLIFVAFGIPAFIVMIQLALHDIYPFGSQQILVIDMYHQYLPFLSELQHKLQTADSLFYTWNGAGGSNFWNLIAYYGASPLNLLLVLFPAKKVVEGVTVILIIKIGLASSFMCIYLRETTKVCNIATVMFSSLYALCSFVMGYYWCIMWMDGVMLLPLVILGLLRIIKGGNPALYCITLALTVFSNYYIAIMVCIFIMFYYPVAYFNNAKPTVLDHEIANPRSARARFCAIKTVKVVLYSLLSIAMAAVMLLPTYKSMQSTYYIDSMMPEEWRVYNNPMDVLNQLLPFSQLTYREGMPNIYCGLIIVLLLIFYITNNTIKLREKSLNIGFLVFLFLSLNLNKLDFIWHGFHFPNQLPYRYSFVVSFILIGMAYKAYLKLDTVTIKTIWAGMAGILGWYIIAQRFLTEKIDNVDVFFYAGVPILVAYTVAMICYRKGKFSRFNLNLIITWIVLCEMMISVSVSFDKVGNSDRDYYFSNYDGVTSLVEKVDKEFARVELEKGFMLNTPAFYHYKGVSQFSSSINSNASYVMEKIGLDGEPGKNRYNYNKTDPVTNAFLGIKYLIANDERMYDSDFKEIDSVDSSYLYENKYPLSVGYVVSNSIWSWDVDLDNPFNVLDDYVRAATDNKYDNVYDEVDSTDINGENMEVSDNGYGAWSASQESESQASTVTISYEAPKTQKYYVYIEAGSCESITAITGNDSTETSIRKDSGSIVNIGKVKEGEPIELKVQYEAGRSGDIVAHVVSLDYDKWNGAYEIISKNQMTVTDWSSRSIKGDITIDEAGAFVTSIPYEDGWTLTVDGEKREIDQLLGDEFIGTSLSAGEHKIELKFTPSGLNMGAIISLLAIILLVLIVLFGEEANRKCREKMEARIANRAKALQEPSESDPEESDYNKEDINSSSEEEQEECRE